MLTDIEQRKALEDIQIEFVDVSIKSIGISGIELKVLLGMYNPNDVIATLDKSEYGLWFNDNYLGQGKIQHKIDILPFTSKQIETNFTLSYAEVGETIVSALTDDQHTWRIKGIAYYDSILGTINIPFDIVR